MKTGIVFETLNKFLKNAIFFEISVQFCEGNKLEKERERKRKGNKKKKEKIEKREWENEKEGKGKTKN